MSPPPVNPANLRLQQSKSQSQSQSRRRREDLLGAYSGVFVDRGPCPALPYLGCFCSPLSSAT